MRSKLLPALATLLLVVVAFVRGANLPTSKSSEELAAQIRRFASFVDIGSTVYYQALCLLNEQTQIKMQCTSTDKIKILRTVYGHNPAYQTMAQQANSIDSCAFSIKDCHFDKEYSIDNECTGKNSCFVTINKRRVMNESFANHQTCKEYNYVQINYQCLPSNFSLNLIFFVNAILTII